MTEHYLSRLPQFFLTPGGACPYLPGKVERKVFARLMGPHAAPLNDALTHSGFRRSQMIAYRPACDGCAACVSVRVVAGRVRRRAVRCAAWSATTATCCAPSCRRKPHASSSRCCRPISPAVTPAAACRTWGCSTTSPWSKKRPSRPCSSNTACATANGAAGRLVACALTDVLQDGLSMVYSFFDPQLAHRSLGTYMILDHVRAGAKPSAFLMSISAIGCAAAARWTTRRASARSKRSARRAGSGLRPD